MSSFAHDERPLPIPPTTVRFRTDGASEYLAVVHGVPISPRTLDKLRCVGGGPEFQKFGRTVLYHRDALDAWALRKLGEPISSTSEVGGA